MKHIYKEHALKYFEKGWGVIPCRGKAPLIKNWSRFCIEKMTLEELEEFINKYPWANIGLPLGPANNVIAIDFDSDDSYYTEQLKINLPHTPCIRRGKKGFALIYKFNGEQASKIKRDGVNFIEILSTGNQLILPPSIHPDTNKPYQWLDEETFWKI